MAGLLEKDFRLLLQRKQALALFLILGVVFGFSMEGSFILGYLPFLMTMLMVGTISYDEMDNGYQFLMTLPINAGIYVREKYLFCAGGTFVSWILAVILYLSAKVFRGESIDFLAEMPTTVSLLPVILILMSVMIPIQIKFGTEKSRVVMAMACGVFVACSFLLVKIVGEEWVENTFAFLDGMSESVFAAGAAALTAVVAAVSYRISYRVLKKKEF